ncbi:F-box protein [Phanerochaete sordida]|uniref:F-box protein n=1 Tax=Phanerochaete sordida TaxID=48140 RepID=A0A9P3GHW2_9APHY|nr:F-box protein [Phanerochaete sordida]
MSTLITASAIVNLPPELIDLIVDQLQRDVRALRSCSLVCKAWLARASVHLFASFRVSCLPLCLFVLDFRGLVASSTRVSWHVCHIEVDVMPQSAADVATLAGHLPRLETLILLGIGLFRQNGSFEWPAAPCTGRALRRLRAVWLPVDLVSSFLGLFAAVDTLELRGPAPVMQGFSGGAHVVRHLRVDADADEALPDVGGLVDPRTLENLVVDLGRMHGAAAPERVHALLQRAGQYVSHLEYMHALGGWTSPVDVIPALVTCSALESFTLTTPVDARTWRESLAMLASAPPQTRHIRFVTRLDGPLPGDGAVLRDVMRALDWAVVARSLAHCRELAVVEVGLLHSAGGRVDFRARPQARDAVLESMPTWFRDVVTLA